MNAPVTRTTGAHDTDADVEFTVTISGKPLAEMAPETLTALQAVIELAREQALATLAGKALPAPSLQLIDRLRLAIVRWDERAKAEKAADEGLMFAPGSREEAAAADAFRSANYAFEDAFNLAIPLFEKEYPNGHG